MEKIVLLDYKDAYCKNLISQTPLHGSGYYSEARIIIASQLQKHFSTLGYNFSVKVFHGWCGYQVEIEGNPKELTHFKLKYV